MPRITDDNKYMDNAMEELEQRKAVHARTGMRDHGGVQSFWVVRWGPA